MEPLKRPWFLLAKIFGLIIGTPLLILGLILYWMWGNWAILINGLVWMILASLSLLVGSYYRNKLERLEASAREYQGTVLEILPAYWIKIGSYVTARIICSYEEDERRREVSSGLYLLSPMDQAEKLMAQVFVENMSQKREVVIYRK